MPEQGILSIEKGGHLCECVVCVCVCVFFYEAREVEYYRLVWKKRGRNQVNIIVKLV